MGAFTTSRDLDTFTLNTSELTLVFSLEDGGLRALCRAGGPNVLGYGEPRPSIDVWLGDRGWLAERTFVRYLHHSADERDGAVELVIVIGIGPLMVYDRYRITGTLLARRVSIENASEDAEQLRGVRLALPWARVGAPESCRFTAPGNSVRPRVPLAVAAEQRRNVVPRRFFAPGLRDGQAFELAPTQAPGLLALHDASGEETLFCWYYSTAEAARPQVDGNGQALTLAHEIEVFDWLRAGVGLSAGTQFILLLREPWPAALSALRRTWLLCGLRPPEGSATWLRDAAIYEVHAAQFGGFRGLAAALPRLRDLGMNTLCLMPVWAFANQPDHPWDGNWEASGNPYAIRDFGALDPTLGAADDLRALVDAAHQHGMRVLLDLPLEGCADDCALVDEHPDWFCCDERGRLARVPRQDEMIAFDWSNAELRRYIVGWALEQARAWDLDGFRSIVQRELVPNWARVGQGHASAGGLDVLEMLDQLRRELKRIKGDAALLCEQPGPIYAASHDAVMDHLPHHMFVHLAINRVAPDELGEWLEDYTHALPYDVARVCYTENYRTRLSNPLADGLRGSRVSRLMLAGMILCGFVPLIRAGQDQDEAAAIGQALRARARHVALRRGTATYDALPCSSPQVLGVLREHADDQLLGLLNVGPHRQTVAVSVPVDRLGLADGDYELVSLLDQRRWVEDGRCTWSRDDLLSVRLTLEPFTAYYLAVRPAVPAPAAPPEQAATPATPPPAEQAEPEPLPAAVELGAAPLTSTNGRRQGRRKREA
jgi:glycosidase